MDQYKCPVAADNKKAHAEFLSTFSRFYEEWQTGDMTPKLVNETYMSLRIVAAKPCCTCGYPASCVCENKLTQAAKRKELHDETATLKVAVSFLFTALFPTPARGRLNWHTKRSIVISNMRGKYR